MTSAAVQLACRHVPAAVWNAVEVQTQARSVKLEQPAVAAASVEHSTIHVETLGVAVSAEEVPDADWALAAKAAAATTKSDLKSMIGVCLLQSGDRQVSHLKCNRGKDVRTAGTCWQR